MKHVTPPKTILHIKELTFILPDDFEGDVSDAFALFLEYRKGHRDNCRFYDMDNGYSSIECLVSSDRDERVSGDAAIYEFDGSKYVLRDLTNPYLELERAKTKRKEENDTE